MCPLASANTDSVCARRSRSRLVSRTAHGSTGKADWRIISSRAGCRSSSARSLDDDVGAVLSERLCLADAVDADDAAEVTGAAGLDAGQRVLEHGRLLPARRRARAGPARNVSGAGLPVQVLALGLDAVDDRVEQLGDAGRREHVAGVGARGDDRARQAGVADGVRRSGPSPSYGSTPSSWIISSTISFLRLPSPCTVAASAASRRPLPRAARSRARRGTSGPRRRAACRRRTRRSR